MGEAVDRLTQKLLIKRGGRLMKLARVYVPPHVRVGPTGKRVKVEGYYRNQYSPSINRAARNARSRAEMREPETSGMMQQIAGRTGGTLEGFQYRMKERQSIARKIESRLGPEKDPYATASQLSDTLRYTMTYPTDEYSTGVRTTLRTMESEGYEVLTKNYWKPGDAYQGVNVAMKTPDGFPVELQFHTPESLETKERIHGLYETFRSTDDAVEKRQVWEQMVEESSKIPVPPGIEGLPTEIVEPYEDAPGITGLPKTDEELKQAS